MDPFSIVLVLIITVIGFYLFFNKRSRPNYPPNPAGWSLPVIGHLPKLGSRPYKTFMSWKATYGPIISLQFGSFPTVVISDKKLIKEAMADPKFAGRPDLPKFKIRSGGERHGVLFGDGPEWVEVRRFVLRHLRDFGFGKKSMQTIIQEEAGILVDRLKKTNKNPTDFRPYVNIAVLNSLWCMIASERFDHDDPKMTMTLAALGTSLKESEWITSVALFIPWLSKLFGLREDTSTKNFIKFHASMAEALQSHAESLQPGQPRDLMDALLIEQAEKATDPNSFFHGDKSQTVIHMTVIDLFIAGSETTTTALTFFGMYMSAFPEIQEKVYAEIEQVVGRSRIPSIEDKGQMPYTEAVTLEVLRMSSFVPVGIFHSTHADAELGGYFIPKDTMVITNLYSCHYDTEYWGDPEQFRPERFLSSDGKSLVKHEDAMLAFSTGKRVCLGENMARTEFFIFATSICQQFKLTFDPAARPVTLEPQPGVALNPAPHKLIFTERS